MERIQTNNKNKAILQAHKTLKIKTRYLNKKHILRGYLNKLTQRNQNVK